MPKLYFLLIYIGLSISLISCAKIYNFPTNFVEIEKFRQPGMSDYELLQRMVDSLPENTNILLEPRTYTLDHTVIVMKSHNFYGPATIKRENQKVYTLMESAVENSIYLILDHTDGLRVPDRFILVSGAKDFHHSTPTNVIIRISGDTVFLNRPMGKMVNQQSQYPIGTKLFKNINFFWVIDAKGYPRHTCSFHNLIFDGNRENNEGTYSWYLNAAVMALTKGPTKYRNCSFINSPGETIVGHNADIRYCTFKNLNGSAFHTSADRVYNTEDEVHSILYNNHFENTNQISTTIGGHSEGVITHSNSGGYYTAEHNTFINVGESVLGALYPSLHEHDWGTNHITFTNNSITTNGRMVYLIDVTTEGKIVDVNIADNKIFAINPIDRTDELKKRPGITLENQVNQ